MMAKMYPILYLRAAKFTADETEPFERLAIDASRQRHCKKLRGSEGLFRYREGDKRYIFMFYRYEDTPYLVPLDVVYNHDYDKSPFLNRAYLKNFLSTSELNTPASIHKEDFEPVATSDFPERGSASSSHQPQCIDMFNRQLLVLRPNQEAAVTMPLPAQIIGPGGTGKTCVLKAMMHLQDPEKPILFVAQSQKLVDRMKKEEFSDSPQVILRSYQDLLADAGIDRHCCVDRDHFDAWFDAYNKKDIKIRHVKNHPALKISRERVYQEFRIRSGYTSEDYLQLGNRQSLLHDGDAEWVSIAFDAYMVALEAESVFHPVFSHVAWPFEYASVFVDEFPDLSLKQLQLLFDLSPGNQVALAGDAHHQRLLDEVSNLPHLEQYVFKLLAQPLNAVNLSESFRCAPRITQVAALLIQLKYDITHCRDKGESRYTELNEESMGSGHVSFYPVGQEPESFLANTRDARTVIITLPECVEEAKATFGDFLIFTVAEAKGLEFEEALLYRIFDAKDRFKKERALAQSPFDEAHPELIPWFNALITAATRARSALTIVQNRPKRQDDLFSIFLKKLQPLLEESELASSKSTAQENLLTCEDWLKQANYLCQAERAEQAQKLITETRRRFKLGIFDLENRAQENGYVALIDFLQKKSVPKPPEGLLSPGVSLSMPETPPSSHANQAGNKGKPGKKAKRGKRGGKTKKAHVVASASSHNESSIQQPHEIHQDKVSLPVVSNTAAFGFQKEVKEHLRILTQSKEPKHFKDFLNCLHQISEIEEDGLLLLANFLKSQPHLVTNVHKKVIWPEVVRYLTGRQEDETNPDYAAYMGCPDWQFLLNTIDELSPGLLDSVYVNSSILNRNLSFLSLFSSSEPGVHFLAKLFSRNPSLIQTLDIEVWKTYEVLNYETHKSWKLEYSFLYQFISFYPKQPDELLTLMKNSDWLGLIPQEAWFRYYVGVPIIEHLFCRKDGMAVLSVLWQQYVESDRRTQSHWQTLLSAGPFFCELSARKEGRDLLLEMLEQDPDVFEMLNTGVLVSRTNSSDPFTALQNLVMHDHMGHQFLNEFHRTFPESLSRLDASFWQKNFFYKGQNHEGLLSFLTQTNSGLQLLMRIFKQTPRLFSQIAIETWQLLLYDKNGQLWPSDFFLFADGHKLFARLLERFPELLSHIDCEYWSEKLQSTIRDEYPDVELRWKPNTDLFHCFLHFPGGQHALYQIFQHKMAILEKIPSERWTFMSAGDAASSALHALADSRNEPKRGAWHGMQLLKMLVGRETHVLESRIETSAWCQEATIRDRGTGITPIFLLSKSEPGILILKQLVECHLDYVMRIDPNVWTFRVIYKDEKGQSYLETPLIHLLKSTEGMTVLKRLVLDGKDSIGRISCDDWRAAFIRAYPTDKDMNNQTAYLEFVALIAAYYEPANAAHQQVLADFFSPLSSGSSSSSSSPRTSGSSSPYAFWTDCSSGSSSPHGFWTEQGAQAENVSELSGEKDQSDLTNMP